MRIRRKCYAQNKMSRIADRVISGEETRLEGGSYVDTWRRVTRRPQTLCGGGVPQRVRENQFRHAHSAETFRGVESDHRGRRHRLDADSQWPFVCGQPGERLLRRRAWDELQIEPERDEINRARHTLHQRRAD